SHTPGSTKGAPSSMRRAMLEGRFTLPLDENPWHRTPAMATTRLQFPHCYASLDASVRRELVEHAATDGFPLTGILYRPARRDADTVVLAMHPRVDFSRHYLVPGLVGGGYAFMGATTRYLNHDADALHERLLLDVAGSIAFLRERGFRRVVLV